MEHSKSNKAKLPIHRYVLAHECDENYLRTHQSSKTSRTVEQIDWVKNKAYKFDTSVTDSRDASISPQLSKYTLPVHRYALAHDCDENFLRVNQSNKVSKPKDQFEWIETKAYELNKEMWKHRTAIWPDGVPTDPVKLLDPDVAIQFVGFKYEEAEFLGGLNGNGIDKNIAGIIDRVAKRISVSNRWSYSTQRFTAAHELAHAVLHEGAKLHRDRPLDGSIKARDQIEIEADKFATFFLMPKNLVIARFQVNFGNRIPFTLTEEHAYALDPTNPDGIIEKCKCVRDVSRLLAGAKYFNRNSNLRSLAEQFGVSVETMAIRLEELKLVAF